MVAVVKQKEDPPTVKASCCCRYHVVTTYHHVRRGVVDRHHRGIDNNLCGHKDPDCRNRSLVAACDGDGGDVRLRAHPHRFERRQRSPPTRPCRSQRIAQQPVARSVKGGEGYLF